LQVLPELAVQVKAKRNYCGGLQLVDRCFYIKHRKEELFMKNSHLEMSRTIGTKRVAMPVEQCGFPKPIAYVTLPEGHKCKGCVWYVRDASVLFCPFQNCIRNKEEFKCR